jgi:hypothetical protein
MATIALIAAWVSLAAAVVLLVLAALGLRHARRVGTASAAERIPASATA